MRVEVIIRKDTIFLKILKVSISPNYAPHLASKRFCLEKFLMDNMNRYMKLTVII